MDAWPIILRFTVYGDPRRFALKRARARRQGATARVYDPPENLSAKDEVKAAAMRQTPRPIPPHEGALMLHVVAHVPVPKSFSKRKRSAVIEGTIYPTTRPDLSNIVKLIEDALNGIYYRDDSQFCHVTVEKRYAVETPALNVTIRQMPGGAT